MSKFSSSIRKFVTCEVLIHGKVSYFAKLSDGSWVAVKADGSLDWVEIKPEDLNDMLTSMESIGASVRFTNHSAA